mmetsp:Transcript_763/g.2443  ORF Transcript_763/g.2443 Transcript_763/m.2443 type:complete len:157 (-) Transcript_763:310-780(-)
MLLEAPRSGAQRCRLVLHRLRVGDVSVDPLAQIVVLRQQLAEIVEVVHTGIAPPAMPQLRQARLDQVARLRRIRARLGEVLLWAEGQHVQPASGQYHRGDCQQPINVHIHGDLDQRRAGRLRRDVVNNEPSQYLVLGSHVAFAMKDREQHPCIGKP